MSTNARIAANALAEFVAGAERHLDVEELTKYIETLPANTPRESTIAALLAVLLAHLIDHRSAASAE